MRFLASLTQAPGPSGALERLKAVPTEFWMRLGIGVAAFLAVIFIIRKLASMNKVVLAAVTFIVLTFVGFNWIYERGEPAWATPVVNFLAGFLPSKGPHPKNSGSD